MTEKLHKRSRLTPEARNQLNGLERVAHALTKDDPTFEGPRTNAGPLRSVAAALNRMHVAAWHVSVAGVLVTLAAVIALPAHPVAAGVLILLGVVFDGTDGVLARLHPHPAPFGLRGDVIDTLCDLARVLVILSGFTAAGYVPAGPGTWLLVMLLVTNAWLNAAKNRSALGRALSLFNQTFAVCGAMGLLIAGRTPEVLSRVPLVINITNGLLVILILQSSRIWWKRRRQ